MLLSFLNEKTVPPPPQELGGLYPSNYNIPPKLYRMLSKEKKLIFAL